MKSESSSPRSPVSVEKINILILLPYSRQIGTILPLMPTTPDTPCLHPKKGEEPSKGGNVMLLLIDFSLSKDRS